MPSVSHNLLCASILPHSLEELNRLLSDCRTADIIELRLDLLHGISLHNVRSILPQQCIATVRSPAEGGQGQHTTADTIAVLQEAINAGIEYVDVELARAHDILPHLQMGTAQLILSTHTHSNSHTELLALVHKMLAVDAAVYKIVYTAATLNDNLIALALQRIFAEAKKQYIVHAMGENGTLSRVLGAVHGNAWTFVAINNTSTTAAGQLTLQQAQGYGLRHKQQQPALLGLLGWPTQYSKGWLLHNALLAQHFPNRAVPYLYVNFPTQHVREFWQAWQPRLSGLSITLPHKEHIVDCLDVLSPDVEASGMCNTAVCTSGQWHGYNTDIAALRSLLAPHQNTLAKGTLVVGTGGTAHSAIVALQSIGVQHLYCTGRNADRGANMAQHFGIEFLPDTALDKQQYAGLLHTTPVGMMPNAHEIPNAARVLQPGMVVLDAIYNPARTRLLAHAQEIGCTTIPGVEMFIAQATEQFRLFTGMDIRTEDVRTVWQRISAEEHSG